jgi:hypothetical protein
MAEGGSSHAKLRRRRAKAQMIGDGDECIQVCKFDDSLLNSAQ